MSSLPSRYITECIDGVVVLLMEPIREPLDFFVSSTKYVKDMKDEMEKLNVTKEGIQNRKEAAEANNRVVPDNVWPWLEDFEKLSQRSQSVEIVGPFNMEKRYKAGKESFKILKEIKLLEARKSNIEFTNAQRPPANVASTLEHGYTFESRVPVFNGILESLQSNNETQRMIALCGMGGLGKTTLIEQLNHVVQNTNMFHKVLKVTIGQTSDPVALQRIFAECLTRNDLTEKNKSNRAEHLGQEFVNMSENGKNKILVIMDDIWEKFDLKNVGLSPLPIGFKLLLVSRDESICTRMRVQPNSIFNIRVLNDEEAEDFFFRIARPSLPDGDDHALIEIGKRIVKKCRGLPMAIATIADNLSGSIKDEWEAALKRLEKDDHKDLDSITHVVFEMSYENLQDEDNKAVFLLCGLFPGNFNIPIEDLMMYGWGLKLFTEVRTLAEARMRVNTCVNNLIRANLLIKSDRVGCVKMHNLVRAFSLSDFSKVKQASIVNHDNMTWERLTKDTYERILLKGTGMSGFPTDFNYPNLLFLMLMDGYKHFTFPEDMHKRMKNLEVVSYENMGTPELPITFLHSSTLRTLRIHSCSLKEDISFLGCLSNLETLSLVDCNIRWLPSAIGKLEKLKLLDLTGCIDLYIDPGVFQNFRGLEELYMRASKGTPVKFTHANCDELQKISQVLFALELEFFNNKLQPKNLSFKNLERFRISIGCELKNYDSNSFRNTLNLVTECNELKECNIMHLFEKTEELRLQVKYMIHFEDISLHHTFSQLRILRISKCEDLTYLFTVDVANGLKKLERLTISECPVLESLIGSGVGVVALNKLKFMSLKDLPKMVSLWDNVIELPELVKLRLDGLPNFTSIYPDSKSTTSTMQALLHKEGGIPKLEELYISMMRNLKQIWPSEFSTSENNDVPTLRQIRVSECDSLNNLFPRNPFPLLNHLEEVVVRKCGSLEVLFNIDFESVGGIEKHSSSRLRKIEVDDLGKLKELWRMLGVDESHTLVNNFKAVHTIQIKNCGNFRDIFTPTTTNFDLGGLTNYLSSCNSGELEERERKNKMDEGNQEINATYPSYLLYTCPHLQSLEISFDERVKEVVFDMDSQNTRQSATIQPPLLLPYLQRITLSGLDMSHVWKCNWNKFLIPQHQPLQFPFQNLTHIILWFCHKTKYLFSPLMAKYISKLKTLYVFNCHGFEEVMSSRDDENTTSTSSHLNTTYFPCLDTLSLRDLRCLKRIDGGDTWSRSDKVSSNITNTIQDHFQSGHVMGSCWSLCQYPKKIYLNKCDVLSSLIPCYALGQMKRLEELEIYKCSGMMEVFENELKNNNTNNNVEGSGAGTSLTSLPLKNSSTAVVPQLSNLNIVCIHECDLLTHIFTFSTLKTLNHLKALKVKRCETIQVIVKEENQSSSKVVVLPRLETLELDGLPNLKGFFLGMNDFLLPSLVNVMINDCKEWVVFTSGQLETPKLKYLHTSIGKYRLEHGINFQTTFPTFSDPSISNGMASSFHNLTEIDIEEKEVGTTIIPSQALLHLEKLEQISIKTCNVLQEVFEVVAVEGSGSNESQTVVKVPNLTQVKLEYASSLKYLWKSNQWMVLEFPNLTTISIHYCPRLEHVFTCSMAGSLVQLQDLSINLCSKMKVIVKEEEEECDAKVNEIMLPRLKSVTLSYLGSIEGFCLGKRAFSCPSLDTLKIIQCSTLQVFTKGHLSTPKLKVIETSFGMCDIKTDINSFIETKQEEGHEF